MKNIFLKYLAVFLLTFLFFALLPRFFYLNYWHPLYPYKLMWLNLLGSRYELILEVPKPLFAVFAGLVPPQYTYLVISLFCGLLSVCFAALSREITGDIIWGLFAAFFYFFCSADVLPDFIFPCGWPIIYISLQFFSLLLFVKGRYGFACLVLFLCGLLRPEAWLYGLLYPFWIFLRREKILPGYFLPLLAPFVWLLFDYLISGNFLFSYYDNKKYALISGLAPTGFFDFWPQTIKELLKNHKWYLLLAGIVGMALVALKSLRAEKAGRVGIIAPMTAMVFLCYWIFSLKKDFFFYGRFFSFSIAAIIFCAAIFIGLLPLKKQALIIILCLACIASFDAGLIGFSLQKRRGEEIQMRTTEQLGDFLQGRFRAGAPRGKIAAEGVNLAYFSFRFGEGFSKKLITLRQLAVSPGLIGSVAPGFIVYQQGDFPAQEQWGFLLKPSRYVFAGKYTLVPVFITPNKEGVIYEINGN